MLQTGDLSLGAGGVVHGSGGCSSPVMTRSGRHNVTISFQRQSQVHQIASPWLALQHRYLASAACHWDEALV